MKISNIISIDLLIYTILGMFQTQYVVKPHVKNTIDYEVYRFILSHNAISHTYTTRKEKWGERFSFDFGLKLKARRSLKSWERKNRKGK